MRKKERERMTKSGKYKGNIEQRERERSRERRR